MATFRWLDERLDLRGAKRDLLDREVPAPATIDAASDVIKTQELCEV